MRYFSKPRLPKRYVFHVYVRYYVDSKSMYPSVYAYDDIYDINGFECFFQTIVALLEHISQGLDTSTTLPSQEALGEMKDNKSFKEKNLATAERTMASLQAEHRKREKELEILK